MKNSVLSLFKKKTSNHEDGDSNSPSSNNHSSSSSNISGSTHSGSFSNSSIGDILQNGSQVYNSLPESGLSYGHIQTPFNLFELNRRMYQTNSQALLQQQKQQQQQATTPGGGGNNRLSLNANAGSTTPQQQPTIALTPSLLMGKRKELNRVSTASPTAEVTPRSSSPSITTTTTTSTINTTTTTPTAASTTTTTTAVGANSTTTPTTTAVVSETSTPTTPTIKTTTASTPTTTVVSSSNANIIKTVLSDQDKLIALISSYLIPHRDYLKSRELLTGQHFGSVLLLNKKWHSITLANTTSTLNDQIVKLWAILVEEMYEPAANIENDHMSRKFIELYCKQHNIEVATSTPIPSTPTSATNNNGGVSTPTSTTGGSAATATTKAGTIKKAQKPPEVLNPQDFYSLELSQLTYTPDPDSNIVIQENQIEHASLNKLIEELTSHTTYDIHFLHTFMLTFRNFTDKETILKKLEERFNYPPNCPPEEFGTFKREILDKIRLRIINSIKYWIDNFFVFDFDSEMMQFLEKFIAMVRQSNQNALAKAIETALDRVKNSDSAGKVITKMECPEILKLKKKVFSKKKTYSMLDYPLAEVARQMSLIDYAMFKKIEPKECLNQAWNKEHRVTKAPNISRMIHHFNQFSGFVATEILKQEDLEKRVKCVEKFIELANHCKTLNNFNAVFSIMSGLNSSSIHRLSKTWELISEEAKKSREDLLAITNTNGNFANLRNMLKSVNPPCVPYNGVFLTDLTFIEDGSPKYINGLINFGKCRLFAKVIRDIQTYQNTRYYFEEYKELKDMIESVEKLSDDELFNMSLQVQPRAQKKKKAAGSSTANLSKETLKDDDDDEKKPEKLDF